MYYNNVLELMGHTPLVKINKLNPNKDVMMLADLEFYNPGGSIKDRIGQYMIQEGIRSGKLKPGGTIVEATGAGNTGIGLAICANILGYKCIFTVPDKVSEQKINFLKSLGAKIVICPTAVSPDDPRSYYRMADKIAKETEGAYQPDQYNNMANPAAHYETTGPHIWNQTEGKVSHVIVTIGSGGTISGIGKFLKQKNELIKIIGVDHTNSVYYTYFKTGKIPKATKSFKTEGFGEDFLPKTADLSVIDDIYEVDDKESFMTARKLARKEGILAGSSSGAALSVARKVSENLKKGLIVVVMPDTGTNYLSKFYSDSWMKENRFL